MSSVIFNKVLIYLFSFQHIPHIIVNIQAVGDRVIVSDVQESVHFVKYRRGENQVQSSLVVRCVAQTTSGTSEDVSIELAFFVSCRRSYPELRIGFKKLNSFLHLSTRLFTSLFVRHLQRLT